MIHLRCETKRSGIDTQRLRRDVRKVLRAMRMDHCALSVSLVPDDRIRVLNREHRGKDAATDVLSFPLYDSGELPAQRGSPVSASDPERLLGDVVIGLDTAQRQAAQYDAPLQNEVNRLLIHGILHILGHDHERAGERVRMEAEERRLAAIVGMPWPYDGA